MAEVLTSVRLSTIGAGGNPHSHMTIPVNLTTLQSPQATENNLILRVPQGHAGEHPLI